VLHSAFAGSLDVVFDMLNVDGSARPPSKPLTTLLLLSFRIVVFYCIPKPAHTVCKPHSWGSQHPSFYIISCARTRVQTTCGSNLNQRLEAHRQQTQHLLLPRTRAVQHVETEKRCPRLEYGSTVSRSRPHLRPRQRDARRLEVQKSQIRALDLALVRFTGVTADPSIIRLLSVSG
jgi:hypothetical protein